MLFVVKAQASDGLDIVSCQRCKQKSHVRNLARYIMFAKDVPSDHPPLRCLRNIGFSRGENGVAVIGFAVFGEEANKSLKRKFSVSASHFLSDLIGCVMIVSKRNVRRAATYSFSCAVRSQIKHCPIRSLTDDWTSQQLQERTVRTEKKVMIFWLEVQTSTKFM